MRVEKERKMKKVKTFYNIMLISKYEEKKVAIIKKVLSCKIMSDFTFSANTATIRETI